MGLVRRGAGVMQGAHADDSTDKSIDAIAPKQTSGAVFRPGANHHFQFTE
jgi:hypothetical protein